MPFVLAGDRAAVVGEEERGIREILLHPFRAVADLRSGLPAADRVQIATGAVRRHLPAEGGAVVESALVLRRLPGAVLRWSLDVSAGEGRPLPIRLTWRAPAAADVAGRGSPVAAAPESGGDRAAAGLLRIRLADGGGALVFALLGAEGRWRVERGNVDGIPDVRVGLRADLLPGRPVAVVFTVARDGGAEADAVLARVGNTDAEIRGWSEAERREREEELTLSGGDPRLGPALAWARRRLAASVIHPGGRRPGRIVSGYGPGCSRGSGPEAAASPGAPVTASPLEAVWTGHGLLAAGRQRDALEVAHRLLDHLRASGAGDDPSSPDAVAGTSLALHFLAASALWTGQARMLHRGADALEPVLDRLAERPAADGPDVGAVAAAAAFRDMADAVEAGGDPERGAHLRSRWESLRDRLGERAAEARTAEGGTRRLLPDPAVLAAVLGVPVPAPGPIRAAAGPAVGAGTGLLSWALWRRGDPDEALERWSAFLLQGAGEGRGLWARDPSGERAGDGCPWHSASTALAVAPLVFGLLGARADAAYGRLRMAPRPPGSWERFEVGGLRVGDVRVRLSYRREGLRHTFVLVPARGRIPLNVVFEPLLPTGGVRGVLVDGEEADLETRQRGDRTGVRLQLPLDSKRVITVDGADEHGD